MKKTVFTGNTLLEIQGPKALHIIDKHHLRINGFPSIRLIEERPQVVNMLQDVVGGNLKVERLTPMYSSRMVHATVDDFGSGNVEITLRNPSLFGLGIFRRLWIATGVRSNIPLFTFIWKQITGNDDQTFKVVAVYWRDLADVFGVK